METGPARGGQMEHIRQRMVETGETQMDESSDVPLGQRLFDRPFVLLWAGMLVMFLFYTGWGLAEILLMPDSALP